MVLSFGKVLPRVMALAAVGYCVWPSLRELTSDSRPKSPTKLPELAASLFSPVMPPNPKRDPFADAAAQLAAAKKSSAGAANVTGAAGPDGEKFAKATDSREGLKLNATCVVGDQRLAVINGQLYAARDQMSSESVSGPPFRVLSVSADKVCLERDGKTVELTYTDVVADSAASQPGRAPAKQGAAAAGNPQEDSVRARSGGSNRSSKARE